MTAKPRLALMLLYLAGTGCAVTARGPAEQPALAENSGLVHVYLDAWPAEAAALTVRLAEVSLVREDGLEVPLALDFTEAGSVADRRPRLLARGAVPSGRYSALSVRAASAMLRTADGAGALRLAEPVTPAPVRFALLERRGVVLLVALDARAALADEGALTAAFTARTATLPAMGVLGLVASEAGASVTFIDKRNGAVGGVVPTGRRPSSIALDRDRRRAFVAAAGDDLVEKIDLEQGAVTERRLMRGGDEPIDVALLPDGRTLLVVNRGSGTLSFLDAEGLIEIERLTVGNGPRSVAVERAGGRAYVFNSLSASVAVVNLADRQVVARVAVDPGPLRGQFNRAQDRLWVLHESSPNVTAINTRGLAVAQRLNIGSPASAIQVDPRSDRIYVARRDGTGIDIYDPASLLPVDAMGLTGSVAYLAIEAEGNALAAALPASNLVQAISITSRAPSWGSEVPSGPGFVAFVSER